MNQLSLAKRAQVISCIVEGVSIRATTRLTNVCKDTVLRLLCDVGRGCRKLQDEVALNLPCKRLELDEIWSFCHTKDRHIRPELKGKAGIGSQYAWVALDPDSKLIVEWLVGTRDAENAIRFVAQVFSRLSGRVQITSDGYKPYVEAVERAFGIDVDYAMLVKKFRGDNPSSELKRWSGYVGSETQMIAGRPNPELISTSLVERQNLTMRMSMRRFTRKTNAFSKKFANHEFAVALHCIWYNFCRIHSTLRVTPAMEIGLSDHVWDMQELVHRVLILSENQRAA